MYAPEGATWSLQFSGKSTYLQKMGYFVAMNIILKTREEN